MPPLIATLATLALYRGLAEGISEARSVRGYPDWFYLLGQGDALGVPAQLWLLAGRGRWSPAFVLGFTVVRPHHLCDRLQRDCGALLGPARRPHQAR